MESPPLKTNSPLNTKPVSDNAVKKQQKEGLNINLAEYIYLGLFNVYIDVLPLIMTSTNDNIKLITDLKQHIIDLQKHSTAKATIPIGLSNNPLFKPKYNIFQQTQSGGNPVEPQPNPVVTQPNPVETPIIQNSNLEKYKQLIGLIKQNTELAQISNKVFLIACSDKKFQLKFSQANSEQSIKNLMPSIISLYNDKSVTDTSDVFNTLIKTFNETYIDFYVTMDNFLNYTPVNAEVIDKYIKYLICEDVLFPLFNEIKINSEDGKIHNTQYVNEQDCINYIINLLSEGFNINCNNTHKTYRDSFTITNNTSLQSLLEKYKKIYIINTEDSEQLNKSGKESGEDKN